MIHDRLLFLTACGYCLREFSSQNKYDMWYLKWHIAIFKSVQVQGTQQAQKINFHELPLLDYTLCPHFTNSLDINSIEQGNTLHTQVKFVKEKYYQCTLFDKIY